MKIIQGDCIEEMDKLIEDGIKVDSIVTDPPYGLGFLGNKWDALPPGVDVFERCIKLLKPGGHLLAFGGTRTYHRLAVAVEDSGFEIRDMIAWLYGSGFPKSYNISKGIDKKAGAEREDIGAKVYPGGHIQNHGGDKQGYEGGFNCKGIYTDSKPSTYDGWGTALKPAQEPIVVARKPFNGTVIDNVLQYGTGAINIDACRVEGKPRSTHTDGSRTTGKSGYEGGWGSIECIVPQGRFPANLIHDGSDEVISIFPANQKSGKSVRRNKGVSSAGMYSPGKDGSNGDYMQDVGYSDSGSVARFFYCAKASKKDRGENNNHPTVKPVDLMRYLVRLVTPSGGIVLDPFMGSGSTGKAAKIEGFDFIGIEKESDYIEIARLRIENAEFEEPEKDVQKELF